MNKERRKLIQVVIDRIEELKADLETAVEDEQAYLDSIPENLMNSERYEKAEDAVGNLESAMDSLNDAEEALEEAMA